MTCGIYKIKNKVNGKMYIGQSVDIERRWKDHMKDSIIKDGHLYSAFEKYGIDTFLFEVIVECDEHMLDEFEICIIKLYDTTDRTKGYNLRLGGANGRHSDESKKKMSESHKGKKKGKTSDETKKKLSDANKGKPKSSGTKRKMSESQIKRRRSERCMKI